MADASYDVVLVGGGNKGLIAAMYLAKYGGLSVGIFEERHELGGGWSSEEGPAPGFLANICASTLANPLLSYSPVYEDFPEWIEHGVKPFIPTVSHACCFSDDRWVGIFSQEYDPSQEKTASLIARFSEQDAETWLWLCEKMNKYFKPAMLEYNYNPPPPPGVPDAREKLLANADAGLNPQWRVMTTRQLMKDLFENIDVQLAFTLFVQSAGNFPDIYGGALPVITGLTALLNHGTLQGGTHTLAHACQRVILENGGRYFTRHPVDKIIVENGTARGVLLADGTAIEARKAVLSGVDPYQLCVELVGEEHLGPKIIRKIENLESNVAITWYTWAMKERPRYRAEDFSPELTQCAQIALSESGELGMQRMMNEVYRLRMGLWPEKGQMHLSVREYSHYCPGYAPPGRACILSEVFVPSVGYFSEQEWKEKEKTHAEEILWLWGQFAPNVSWDNVIGYLPVTPHYTAGRAKNYARHGSNFILDVIPPQMGRFRPIPELSSGRMPIKNLYATGAGWHPGPGSNPYNGYNIYKVMAEDLGLRKPWEENGRPY
jgi:phytoene dehydrogenase-like protein